MTQRGKARLVIGVSAGAAMAWSGAMATIPVVGTVAADTVGLTAISVSMAYGLAIVYNKNKDVATLAAFSTVVLGKIFGELGIKALASLVPVFGSLVNASITGVLHTAIGLVICELFEEGRELDSISLTEFRLRVKKKEQQAKEEREKYEQKYKDLSDTDKARIKALQREMRKKDLPAEELDRINREIAEIFRFES